MPDRCVVGGCSNESNGALGISLHRIPFFEDERAEAKKRRKRWTDFVSNTRANWKASKLSAVCSEHFETADYETPYILDIPSSKKYLRLKKDDFGITVYPTKKNSASGSTERPSSRSLRKVLKQCLHFYQRI